MSDLREQRRLKFPLGASITLESLQADPYPHYAQLREDEPISWLDGLDMWYVTRYDDVRDALLEPTRFTTSFDRSPILDTFGAMMLTTEGLQHDRYRRAAQSPFTPSFIRTHLESAIWAAAAALVSALMGEPLAELRSAFASRLPVQIMLRLCGLPCSAEPDMRRWYDSFELALANFTADPLIRKAAHRNVGEFHALLDEAIAHPDPLAQTSLLWILTQARSPDRLSNDEIKRNISIIFFGGISTVEALILNALWALFAHPATFERVRRDHGLLFQVLDETMRWAGPVQSATRHVTQGGEWRGVHLQAGDTINCMLASANHDPSVFSQPQLFDIDRANIRRHLGFATGPHGCLGFQLARAEAAIGLRQLLTRFPALKLVADESDPPTGYEFRQPRRLTARLMAD